MAVAEASEARLTILNSQVLASATEFITTIRQSKITALICADRKLVISIINLLQEIPLQIPKDLSLLFLVSNTWDLPFANPTRVSLNRDVIGRMAVQRLVERLQGSLSGYQQIQVPCRFVIGTTTAPVTIN
jgi:DNA-binding LacI/PurR family transcriptional regulator